MAPSFCVSQIASKLEFGHPIQVCRKVQLLISCASRLWPGLSKGSKYDYLVLFYSQKHPSIATQISFWHLFDGFQFEMGQSDFQNKSTSEHVMKNIACLFIKFQSWKRAGFCANTHESVLAINKFYSRLNFDQIYFLHTSKKFSQNSVLLKHWI